MISANFKVERSNIGTYLKTYIYRYPSLFNFLNKQNMLKEKYKALVVPGINYQFSELFVPVKMASKMPFILVALVCERLNDCLSNTGNLKIVKSRAKNYYCEDLIKKLVSIFGNEKAWDEFEINNEWKPKLKFTNKSKVEYPQLVVPYFSFMKYEVDYFRRSGSSFMVSLCWANKRIVYIKQPFLLFKLNNISKRRISRVLNNPNKKTVNDFQSISEVLEDNKDLLTEDGIILQKDLNLIRTLI